MLPIWYKKNGCLFNMKIKLLLNAFQNLVHVVKTARLFYTWKNNSVVEEWAKRLWFSCICSLIFLWVLNVWVLSSLSPLQAHWILLLITASQTKWKQLHSCSDMSLNCIIVLTCSNMQTGKNGLDYRSRELCQNRYTSDFPEIEPFCTRNLKNKTWKTWEKIAHSW